MITQKETTFINQVTMLSRATRLVSVITFRPLTSLLNNIFAGFIARDIKAHHESKQVALTALMTLSIETLFLSFSTENHRKGLILRFSGFDI